MFNAALTNSEPFAGYITNPIVVETVAWTSFFSNMAQNCSTLHNSSDSQSPIQEPLPVSFQLTAPPNCDIWRKPPSTSDFNAPFPLRSFPLSSFRAARVTIQAQWSTKFDQGGLLLILPGENGLDRKERRWIKTGVEFFNGRPNLSTVATDRWSD